MSGSSKLHNIAPNTLVPGPVLAITRAGDGKTTADMDFTCRKYDVDKPPIQAKLAKGYLFKDLYPQLGNKWWFLYVDSYTTRDGPGGITTVSIRFIGADVPDGETTFDGAVTYNRNNSLQDRPSLSHPQFLKDTESLVSVREIMKLAIQGVYTVTIADENPDNDYVVVSVSTGAPQGLTISDEKIKRWWDYIVTGGNQTYQAATSEWTKSATGKGRLASSEFAKLGFIDDPDGDPGTPDDMTWLYTGATESISFGGDNANSYSKTWTLGDWPEIVYEKPADP